MGETGNKDCAVDREQEDTRGPLIRNSEGQADGGVTDFIDRDSRQEKKKDCRKREGEEGGPVQLADGKSNGQRDSGGHGPHRRRLFWVR